MQVNRLFEIVYLLLNRKTVTAGELAERFEVSTRTIYRDVDTLSMAGIPIYMSKGRGGGIRLLPDFILNKAVLSEKEKRDVLSALQGFAAVNATEGAVGIEGAQGALSKLSALFGQKDGGWIEIDFSSWGPGADTEAVFDKVKQAVLEHRVLQIAYYNGKGEESHREVEPLKLAFKGQDWYLYAYCRQREEERFFKLARIKEPHLTDERFLREAPQRLFRGEQKTWTEEAEKVVLKINKKLAYRVYDEFPGAYTVDNNGDFHITRLFALSPFLVGYLLSFGDALTVLAPVNLRQALAEEVRRTLVNYQL